MNRSTIKLIALISMLLDHIGSVVIYRLYIDACNVDGVIMMGELVPHKAKVLYSVYISLRIIGRLAFPLFAFMIVEGFRHTHNLKQYIGRLFLFAIISEIPYDLTHGGSIFDPFKQNVMWTFIIAIITIWTLEKLSLTNEKQFKKYIIKVIIICFASALTIFSDGGVGGLLLIVTMYIHNQNRISYWVLCVLSLCIMTLQFMWIQLFAVVALVLLVAYNGKRGNDCKYLYYYFYPLHLLILWGIAAIMTR